MRYIHHSKYLCRHTTEKYTVFSCIERDCTLFWDVCCFFVYLLQKHIQTPQHRALKSSSCMVRIQHFTQHTHFMCYGNETNCLHAHTHSLSSSLYAQYLEIVNCIYENKAMKTPGRLLYATAYDLYRFYSFRYMTGTKAISSE